ncbi:MAG TPA: maleylpyruvate isomerase family mycothiol-dependent enzyme [Streptosporangiaceae bacterium]|nr:maleylpyruvate isomerase family mycothiol-dependent enzyme [Streptosporangiaceae bacterium]
MDGEIGAQLTLIQESTDRLAGTAGALTDAAAAGPSQLPGWTRGHVLTHLARNADGLRNLLHWARTGTKTPMYPSEAARDGDIAAGAGRSAADLAADLQRSAAAFAAAAAGLPAAAWAAQVERRGEPFPARQIPRTRLSELEFHHVDLGAGYQPDDWPAEFVAGALPQVAASFAGRPDMTACRLAPDGWPDSFLVGPAGQDPPEVLVRGAAERLLAWLSGRAGGTGLQVTGAAAVPVPPPWG